MPEGLIVTQCAPTLAGMKTGNLFNCAYDTVTNLKRQIMELNAKLAKKGVRIMVMRLFENKRALIYVYRPACLKRDFEDEGIRNILTSKGYHPEHVGQCLIRLMSRLADIHDFPHEIGCFLGYPSEDILGFMDENRRYKYVGVWQVYGDVDKAVKLFETYRKCTDAYLRHFRHGVSLEALTLSV